MADKEGLVRGALEGLRIGWPEGGDMPNGTVAHAERQPRPVDSQVTALHGHVSVLEEMLGQLFDRIDPILSPSNPVPSEDPNARIQPVLSNLAMQLQAIDSRLFLYVERVQKIIERVEV